MIRAMILFSALLLLAGFSPATSPISSPASSAVESDAAAVVEGGGGVVGSLSDVVDSAVFDIDATQSASYGGTGTTWSNLVASPADGAAQSAYDFQLGDGADSSTYPTFTGTVGDAAAYFLFGITGGIKYAKLAGASTSFLDDTAKNTSGTDFTVGLVVYNKNTSYEGYITTHNAGTSSAGWRIDKVGTEKFRLTSSGGGVSTTLFADTNAAPTDDYVLVIASVSHSGSNVRIWMNTTTATDISGDFNTDTATSNVPHIGVSNAAEKTNPLADGTRVISAFMLNEYIDDTVAATIFDYYETRHGRDYTP